MGLVDGFARGIGIGDKLHRTELLERGQNNRQKQLVLENKWKTEDRDYLERERMRVDRERADQDTLKRLSAIQYSLGEGGELSPDDVSFLAKNSDLTDPETKRLITDGEYRTQAGRMNEILARRFSGENVPKQTLLDSANFLYGDQIGEGKELSGAYPSPDGSGLVFSVKGEGIDGDKPLTKYRLTEQDGDNEVKVIPFSAFADDVAKRNKLISSIEKWRISLGDSSPIANKAAAAKQKAKYAREDKVAGDKQSNAEALEKLKHGYRMEEKGLAKGKDKGKNQKKDFDAGIKELEGLQKALAKASTGIGDFGEKMGEEEKNKQVSILEKAISNRESYLSQLSPELWHQYSGEYMDVPRSGGMAGARQDRPLTEESVSNFPPEQLDRLYKAHSIAKQSDQEQGLAFLQELKQTQPVAFAALTRRLNEEDEAGKKAARQKQYEEDRDRPTFEGVTGQIQELERQKQNPTVDSAPIDKKLAELKELLATLRPTKTKGLASYASSGELASLEKRIEKATGAEKTKLIRLYKKLTTQK